MPSDATSANDPSIARTAAGSPLSTRRRASSRSMFVNVFSDGIEQIDDAADDHDARRDRF